MTDEVVAAKTLASIMGHPGINRQGLHTAFYNRLRAARLSAALARLRAEGRVRVERETGQVGRPAERWYPVPQEGGTGGQGHAVVSVA